MKSHTNETPVIEKNEDTVPEPEPEPEPEVEALSNNKVKVEIEPDVKSNDINLSICSLSLVFHCFSWNRPATPK